MLLNGNHLLFGLADESLLAVRNNHVIDADGEAGLSGKAEAQLLHFVEHLDRGFKSEAQIAVVDQSAHALFLQQTVDVGHGLGQMVVQNGAAHGGVQESAIHLNRLGVDDVLIIIGCGQVNQFAAVTQANGGEGFNRTRLQRHEHFVDVGEGAAFPFRPGLALSQVVQP